MSALGAAIKQERQSVGMTQSRLAEALGVSSAYMCDLEKGNRRVTLERLFQIANQFPESVDVGEWLWLRLRDEWGDAVIDVMQRHARATEATDAA